MCVSVSRSRYYFTDIMRLKNPKLINYNEILFCSEQRDFRTFFLSLIKSYYILIKVPHVHK